MKQPKPKGQFGSSLNNHVLQDLRKKLANNQMIVLALVDHFKLDEAGAKEIIEAYMKKQFGTASAANPVPETVVVDRSVDS